MQRNVKAPRDPEALCEAHAIPLPDECADELMAIHLFEHYYRWQVGALLAEWRRVLKPGGLLVLELPNLEAACRNVLAGMSDQMGMWPLYGDPSHKDPAMCHRWAWTPKSLRDELEGAGFINCKARKPQWHGGREARDMRMEARRA